MQRAVPLLPLSCSCAVSLLSLPAVVGYTRQNSETALHLAPSGERGPTSASTDAGRFETCDTAPWHHGGHGL